MMSKTWHQGGKVGSSHSDTCDAGSATTLLGPTASTWPWEPEPPLPQQSTGVRVEAGSVPLIEVQALRESRPQHAGATARMLERLCERWRHGGVIR
jgi:hypothetical protein